MTPREQIMNASPANSPAEGTLKQLTAGHSTWKTVAVEHLDGERYAIGIRGHVLTVDQPRAAGGDDTAPTPTELFVAALTSSTALYAARFLDRHRLGRSGLRVTSAYTMATDRPSRIASLTLTVSVPTLPDSLRPAFRAVISHCTVHNTLHCPPRINVEIR